MVLAGAGARGRGRARGSELSSALELPRAVAAKSGRFDDDNASPRARPAAPGSRLIASSLASTQHRTTTRSAAALPTAPSRARPQLRPRPTTAAAPRHCRLGLGPPSLDRRTSSLGDLSRLALSPSRRTPGWMGPTPSLRTALATSMVSPSPLCARSRHLPHLPSSSRGAAAKRWRRSPPRSPCAAQL